MSSNDQRANPPLYLEMHRFSTVARLIDWFSSHKHKKREHAAPATETMDTKLAGGYPAS
jgi:hypothetical protein